MFVFPCPDLNARHLSSDTTGLIEIFLASLYQTHQTQTINLPSILSSSTYKSAPKIGNLHTIPWGLSKHYAHGLSSKLYNLQTRLCHLVHCTTASLRKHTTCKRHLAIDYEILQLTISVQKPAIYNEQHLTIRFKARYI